MLYQNMIKAYESVKCYSYNCVCNVVLTELDLFCYYLPETVTFLKNKINQ